MAKLERRNANDLVARARRVIRESRLVIADRRDQTKRLNRLVHTLRSEHSTSMRGTFHGDGKRFVVRASGKRR